MSIMEPIDQPEVGALEFLVNAGALHRQFANLVGCKPRRIGNRTSGFNSRGLIFLIGMSYELAARGNRTASTL
jgi:hypothetical protein